MKRIVQQYAQSKFENLSLIDFRPEVLSAYKRCIETGQLDQVDELYKAMYHEWDALQKDVNKVTSALGTLDFRAVPYAADGAAPTPEAEAVAALVNAALWHAPQPGTGEWQHGFAQLPGAIYHALLRGYNVHEIIWAYDGGMYYPSAYLPVMPQFFAWECRSGEPDRLLLYPRGVGFSDGRAFPRHKFIVALNNQGVDHPMENSILRALVPWFCAAVWGPRWLMQYCQIFGLPIRTFRAGSAEERADLELKLAEQPVVTDVVLLDGEEMTVQSPGSTTGLPQRELIELAEKACHKLILGQTLTSDTSDGGSRAQAQVHSEVMKDELMSIGEFVCGVLNAQLVPAIVRMNYGGTQVPMPELRCSLPNAAATRETVDLLDGMINRLGMSIRRSDVYDKLGIAMPDPGDDVLGPAMAPAPGRDAISAAAAARYPEAGGSTAAALADAAEQAAESVCRAWSAPVREALTKAAAEGKSPQEMLELLESLRCDTALLAEAQESIMRAGLGLSDEEVAASRKQSICRAKDPSKCRVHGKGVSREGEGKAPRKPYQKNEEAETFASSFDEDARIFDAIYDKLKNRQKGVAPDATFIKQTDMSRETAEEIRRLIREMPSDMAVKQLKGQNLSRTRHAVSESGVLHSLNRHALSKYELRLCSDIRKNWDELKVEPRSNAHGPRIVYQMKHGEQSYVLVEQLRHSRLGDISFFVTMYKKDR